MLVLILYQDTQFKHGTERWEKNDVFRMGTAPTSFSSTFLRGHVLRMGTGSTSLCGTILRASFVVKCMTKQFNFCSCLTCTGIAHLTHDDRNPTFSSHTTNQLIEFSISLCSHFRAEFFALANYTTPRLD